MVYPHPGDMCVGYRFPLLTRSPNLDAAFLRGLGRTLCAHTEEHLQEGSTSCVCEEETTLAHVCTVVFEDKDIQDPGATRARSLDAEIRAFVADTRVQPSQTTAGFC